ncbi:hypothetical protein FQN54_005857 [Arachnomyces sp. PD_36]|nr:hypothetical protein FQN54_005857 [Arachnomyces sp. PD_36]
MDSTASSHAKLVFKTAFDRFAATVTADNPATLDSLNGTTLPDVYDAAREIENELAQRRSLKNMRRLRPFLEGVERYSKAVEVLCNGTPYLSWIWSPVTLILRMAADHEKAIEKLIATYGTIGEVLPRFNRKGRSLNDDPEFQRILAVVYSDILEFHEEAYKFFKKSGWKIFFSTLWAKFDRRLNPILESLAKHCEIVDKEANSIDIARAQEWRAKAAEDMRKQEEIRSTTQFQAVLAWLDAKDDLQEDELDRLAALAHTRSCDWIENHRAAKPWICPGSRNLVLWIKGKPGAGKSVLTSAVIRSLEDDPKFTVLYYFCNYYSTHGNKSCYLLRSLVAQLLRRNADLSSYVYEEYIQKGSSPSARQLKKLVGILITAENHVRIVVDGIDEFPEKDQKQIINDLIPLASIAETGAESKILFSSRDIQPISKQLSRYPTVCLSGEREAIDAAIKSYIGHSLANLRPQFMDTRCKDIMNSVEKELIKKAQGMYLWVRLVLQMLDNVHTVADLQHAVRSLPTDLRKFHQYEPRDRDKALRVFKWISLAEKPLQRHELLDAVSLHPGNCILNDETRVWSNVIDLCKPLIEEMPNGSIVFVHFTVKEYLLSGSQDPFVDATDGHHDITFACLVYLKSSFELIDGDVTERQKAVKVAKSFHGLHLYANEYWLKHLFSYTEARNASSALLSEPLVDQLVNLAATHSVSHRLSDQKTIQGDNHSTIALHSSIASSLENNADAKALLQQVIRLNELLEKEKNKGGEDLETFRLSVDSTLFSRIAMKYTEIVHDLLKRRSFPGLDHEELAIFKQNYESSAFACRYPHCPKRTDGFGSSRARDDHEQRHHGQGIKCSEQNCPFSRIGFGTSAALSRHMRDHHIVPETSVAHRFKRRRRNMSNEPDIPQQQPSLIRPDQVQNSPHLSDKQKARYTRRVRSSWDVINSRSADSPEYQTAHTTLIHVARKLRFIAAFEMRNTNDIT